MIYKESNQKNEKLCSFCPRDEKGDNKQNTKEKAQTTPYSLNYGNFCFLFYLVPVRFYYRIGAIFSYLKAKKEFTNQTKYRTPVQAKREKFLGDLFF